MCVLCHIYAVTNTNMDCGSCVVHHSEPDSQTEACLASGNPNSQSVHRQNKERWGGGGDRERVRDSDVQMRSETIDLCGG